MSGAWPLILRGVFVCSWNIPQWFREAHPHPGKPEHVGPLLRIIDALRTTQAVECLGPVFSSPPAHWDSSSSLQPPVAEPNHGGFKIVPVKCRCALGVLPWGRWTEAYSPRLLRAVRLRAPTGLVARKLTTGRAKGGLWYSAAMSAEKHDGSHFKGLLGTGWSNCGCRQH